MTREAPIPGGLPSYDLVGYHAGGLGIALAARNTVTALRSSGRACRLVTVGERAPAAPAAPRTGGSDLTLFEMNPLEIAFLRRQWAGAVGPTAPAVCIPFWELPRLPRAWLRVLRAMQAVLAPTRFVEAALREALPEMPVIHYPQAVFLPDGVSTDRAAWGLAPGTVAFAVAFDVGSDVARKNPWAALDAFEAAFPRGEGDVALLVKVNPRDEVPTYRDQVARLRERVAGDPRVRIIDRWLRYEEVLGLYAACDVLVSLHRSEGLGLHLMEAMSLGRPVVATGWSGNADFMDEANSVPVGYRLVPVTSSHLAYRDEVGRPGQEWAEPDVADAARALRRLRDSPELRAALGARARLDMAARRDAMRRGGAFDRLEAAVAGVEGSVASIRRACAASIPYLVWRKLRQAATGSGA